LIELGAMWRQIRGVWLNIENEEKNGRGQTETGSEHRPIG
jgi:hypothetical protein